MQDANEKAVLEKEQTECRQIWERVEMARRQSSDGTLWHIYYTIVLLSLFGQFYASKFQNKNFSPLRNCSKLDQQKFLFKILYSSHCIVQEGLMETLVDLMFRSENDAMTVKSGQQTVDGIQTMLARLDECKKDCDRTVAESVKELDLMIPLVSD